MARTTRKRKHRGSQTGRGEARGRTSKPKKKGAKGGRSGGGGGTGPARHDRPPSWKSAINRGVFAAAIFFALMLLFLGRTVPQAAALAAFMLAFYIPLGYYTDSFFYRRRQRQVAAQKANDKPQRESK
ncbi:MAG: hypothetical protein ACR2N5_08070 [Solirubrobacterales bacterium]